MNIYVAVNLNLYKYFFAVIEEHGVTKAANRLGVSQSTVSYSIHALERELAPEEVKDKVREIIAQLGATSIKDMGRVMGVANKALAGLSDGRTISGIVKELLG